MLILKMRVERKVDKILYKKVSRSRIFFCKTSQKYVFIRICFEQFAKNFQMGAFGKDFLGNSSSEN